MKIAFLTSDNREIWKKYDLLVPVFGPAPTALLAGFTELGSAVEVHVVSCVRRPVASPLMVAGNIFYHSVVIPSWGMMKTLCAPAVLAVRNKLRQIQPDIVHGQGTERDCALEAVFSGFPSVLTIHGNMREMAKINSDCYHWLTAKLENYALPRAAGVFCNSVYTQGLVTSRVRAAWLVPNAIHGNYFMPIPYRQRGKICRFINVGTVCVHKRQMEILSLFTELHHNGVPVKIDFIGVCDGNSDYTRQFLSEIGKAQQAGFGQYLGTRDVSGLIKEMDSADAMLHSPSEEAFGLVVAEGLARGLKFFGAKIGGVPDICEGAGGAELYELNDWRGLIEGIRRWTGTNVNVSVRYAGNQDLMCSRYHPLAVAKQHLEIYREVLHV
jgi:glycosyltransferase involved in cell wall biosynthesis